EPRRVRGQGEHERQPRDELLDDAQARLRVGHADVHVQTLHALPARARPRVLDELAVVRLVGNRLLARDVGRLGAARRDRAAELAGRFRGRRPQPAQDVERLVGALADAAVQLDDRFEELVLDEAAVGANARDHLARQRQLRERLGVDQHELLLDAEREKAAPVSVFAQRLRRAYARYFWRLRRAYAG